MSASAVFILDLKGRLLISRDYRGDIPAAVATKFATRVLQQEETELRPVVNEEGISYITVKYANLLCLSAHTHTPPPPRTPHGEHSQHERTVACAEQSSQSQTAT